MKTSPTDTRTLRAEVDAVNDIERFGLQIRWQDLGGQVPRRIDLGKPWPPKMTFYLEMQRRITREDVDAVLRTQAISPAVVQVTPDPEGRVGWSELDVYNFEV